MSDGDFDLRDEYRERAWRGFYDGRLVPAAEPAPDGRLLEPQGLLFPTLIAPAYALGGAAGVELLLAALLALPGPWFPGHELVPALPFGAALAAWTLRRTPRLGAVLAAITLAASGWVLLGLAFGARLAPPAGPLPWGF